MVNDISRTAREESSTQLEKIESRVILMEWRKESGNTTSINDKTLLTLTKSLERTKHFTEKSFHFFFSS